MQLFFSYVNKFKMVIMLKIAAVFKKKKYIDNYFSLFFRIHLKTAQDLNNI